MKKLLILVLPLSAVVGLGVVVLTGCEGSSTAFACAGTVQAIGNPATLRRADPMIVRIDRYPGYSRLWSKSWGSLIMSEPYGDYFPFVQSNGDQLLISDPGEPHRLAVFNRINGHLQLATSLDIFDVTCRAAKPLT